MTIKSSSQLRVRIGIVLGLSAVVLISAMLYRMGTETPQRQLARLRTSKDSPKTQLAAVRALIESAHGEFPDAQLYECQLLLRFNRLDAARSRFDALPHPEQCDFDQLTQLAEQAQAAGHSGLAAHILLSAEQRVRQHPLKLKLLIYALYTQENGEEPEGRVLQLCEDYARLAPDDAFPWLVCSSLYHERGVPNLAVQAYREALQRPLPPVESHRVRAQLIQLELLLGELPQAREHCDSLLQTTRDPASLKVVQAMNAELLQREGHPAEAIAILDELLAADSGWFKARALRGRCRFDLGDLPGAIADLSEAVQKNDFDQQSHYLLAQAYQKQKEEQRAAVHWKRSRELNQIGAEILVLENRLRNDLYNRDLKLKLAELNEELGNTEKASAWRRGATMSSRPRP